MKGVSPIKNNRKSNNRDKYLALLFAYTLLTAFLCVVTGFIFFTKNITIQIDYFKILIPVLSGIVALVINFFKKQSDNRLYPVLRSVATMVLICFSLTIMIDCLIFSNPPMFNLKNNTTNGKTETDADENNVESETTDVKTGDEVMSNIKVPNYTVVDWEQDEFFLNLDKYIDCSDGDQSGAIAILITEAIKGIEVSGEISPDVLNESHEYAYYTSYAKELHDGYMVLSENSLLLDYQISMIKEEIRVRMLADELFKTSLNQKLIGDAFELLGDLHFKNGDDTNTVYSCYKEAFIWFESSFRIGIAEGLESYYIKLIVSRIDNIADKLVNLNMDSKEQKMARQIADALNIVYENMKNSSAGLT